MAKKILLTSFQTWLPHQVSNSSDDLLTKIQEQEFAAVLTFLRRLPVDVALASSKAIAIIQTLQPDSELKMKVYSLDLRQKIRELL
jgi:pyroglutamyl-peptidase